MAGSWIGPAFDPLAASSAHWFVGDVLEFTHLDDEGQDQWNSVGLVQSFTPGAGYMVNLLWIQDMSLKDWLLSDHGLGNPGRYDLARSNSLDLTVTRAEPPVQPIGTWRRLGTYADFSLADVHWARKQKVRAVAAVDKGIDCWRRHLPHDHPAALLAPASAPSPPTPLHIPTALPAFPPLLPVGLAQAPTLPIPEICGSLANEIAQLRHEIDERPVLEGGDGLLRRKAPEPAQPEREGSRHARGREVHRASLTQPRRRDPGCSGLFLWRRRGGAEGPGVRGDAVAGFTAASLSVFLFFISGLVFQAHGPQHHRSSRRRTSTLSTFSTPCTPGPLSYSSSQGGPHSRRSGASTQGTWSASSGSSSTSCTFPFTSRGTCGQGAGPG